MLADAIRAEAYRLSKSRTTWFWSVFFVPIMAIVFGLIGYLFSRANQDRLAAAEGAPPELAALVAGGPLDMGQALLESASGLASPPVLLFVLIGAATLYAGDYRWETWRLISARNSRQNLLLGKLAVLAGLALVSMTALLIADQISQLLKAMIFARPLTFSFDGGDFGRFLALFGLAWLRLVQFCMVALLAAVVTRSLLAALFIPLVLGAAQALALPVLMGMGVTPDSWTGQLLMPGTAYEALKALATGETGVSENTGLLALKAWTSLIGWTVLPLAGALAWFQRQDLSKE